MHVSKEAMWLHKLLSKLFSHLLNLLTTLHCDNQSAIKLAITNNYHSYTWHLDQHYHFIREVVAKGTIKLIYCPTEDMVADPLTEALPKWKAVVHASALGLCHACGGVVE